MLVEVTTLSPGVIQVMLNRPQQLNALTHDLVCELHSALDTVASDRSCRVVVLTGAGRAFCVGLDLHGYGDDDRIAREGEALGALTRQKELARLTTRLRELPQPVIAAVNGPAAGGGLALVCASDIRMAVDSSVFAVSFIRAGYSACDLGVSWLLPRIVGVGRAHELMLTGRRFDAAEALGAGLLAAVVPEHELQERVQAEVEEIVRNPPGSVSLTKEGMWSALEIPDLRSAIEFENRQQMVAAMTEDRVEATTAFLEKRAPSYQHR